jgi:hypothetical protein
MEIISEYLKRFPEIQIVSSRGKYLKKKKKCMYNPCQQTDSCLINIGGYLSAKH